MIEPREGHFKIDETIVIKCKATLKSAHKSGKVNSNNNNKHHLNQRQQRPVIHWYKDDEVIKTGNDNKRNKLDPNDQAKMANHKIEIETRQDSHEHHLNSVLTIHNAKLDDSGKYRCIYDSVQESVTVKVFNDREFESFIKNYLSSFRQLFRKI